VEQIHVEQPCNEVLPTRLSVCVHSIPIVARTILLLVQTGARLVVVIALLDKCAFIGRSK
jgi:hypothetical protein